MEDALGDRMKAYERMETSRSLDSRFPIYARIDGRGFSKFTKGLDRPFDFEMSNAMIFATEELVNKTHAAVGYTQSDEISLVWWLPDPKSQMLFRGKTQKLTSILASMATAAFTNYIFHHWEETKSDRYMDRLPHFDARVFQLPDLDEATNAIYWRFKDCTKNAISMAARSKFSHKELNKKNTGEMLQMLADAGINYEDYPSFFKYGSLFARRAKERSGVMRSEIVNFNDDIAKYDHDFRKNSFFLQG